MRNPSLHNPPSPCLRASVVTLGRLKLELRTLIPPGIAARVRLGTSSKWMSLEVIEKVERWEVPPSSDFGATSES